MQGSKHTQCRCWKWWGAWSWSQFIPQLWLKSQLVETILHNEFQSQPCLIIHYTHNDRHWNSQAELVHRSKQTHTAGAESWGPDVPCFSTICDWKVSLRRPFCTMNSNLNIALPFIILIMRHWNSQAAVKLVQESKLTQCRCWNWKWGAWACS